MAEEGTGGRGPRVLILANEELSGADLRDRVVDHLREKGASDVRVVAPALVESTAKHVMGDVDDAIPEARERLDHVIEQLRDAGVEASGDVGDADPITAISDQLQQFGADEILIVAHDEDAAAPAEGELLERAKREFTQPVFELVVAGDGGRIVDTRSAPAGLQEDEDEHEFSANLPPFTPRDLAGIAVGVIGTLGLAFLAVDCADTGDDSSISGACAARILIAMFAALINLAHVVGLFLMESVRYRGVFDRVLARLTLIGTPVAVVVSLFLLD